MKKILVLGANGFVGKNLTKYLTNNNIEFLSPTRNECNLLDSNSIDVYFTKNKPNIVLNVAGLSGGVGATSKEPAKFYYENILLGSFVTHFCWLHNVEKLISLGAGCSYPVTANIPYNESDLFNGIPNKNTYGYGMAKSQLTTISNVYREQYGFDSTVLLPANLYGPNDNYDLQSGNVVPSLIKKIIEGTESVTIWGTGKASRELLFIDDAVKAIVDAIDVNETGPFNLGTGIETSIKELVETIVEITNYKGEIIWDINKPDGQLNRYYNMDKFNNSFGYVPNTQLKIGLEKTIEWYKENNK
jgi:nucleoside-diphosphate-sugar epimerase